MQLAASACKICMRLAASRRKFIPEWLPVACNMNKNDRNLHASCGLTGAVCMRLAATQVQFACNWRATQLQDKRQADKRCVKGRLYIIIIFF
jgi:hypothetical protein